MHHTNNAFVYIIKLKYPIFYILHHEKSINWQAIKLLYFAPNKIICLDYQRQYIFWNIWKFSNIKLSIMGIE